LANCVRRNESCHFCVPDRTPRKLLGLEHKSVLTLPTTPFGRLFVPHDLHLFGAARRASWNVAVQEILPDQN
jgi:hypothetical protein